MPECEVMMEQDWMKDPSLSEIDKNKLSFMNQIFIESRSLSQKEMMPFFMALAMRSKRENIRFTKEEADAVIAVLKARSTPEELVQMDRIMKLYGRQSARPSGTK